MSILSSLDAIQYLPKTGTVPLRSDRGNLIERLKTQDALRLLRHKQAVGIPSRSDRLLYLMLTVSIAKFRTTMRNSRVPPLPRWHITRPKMKRGDLKWAWFWDRVPCGQCGREKALFVPRRCG